MSRICLTSVDLPDSPAPSIKHLTVFLRAEDLGQIVEAEEEEEEEPVERTLLLAALVAALHRSPRSPCSAATPRRLCSARSPCRSRVESRGGTRSEGKCGADESRGGGRTGGEEGSRRGAWKLVEVRCRK